MSDDVDVEPESTGARRTGGTPLRLSSAEMLGQRPRRAPAGVECAMCSNREGIPPHAAEWLICDIATCDAQVSTAIVRALASDAGG